MTTRPRREKKIAPKRSKVKPAKTDMVVSDKPKIFVALTDPATDEYEAMGLATEYLKDFNLKAACHRFNLDFERGKYLFETGPFYDSVREVLDTIKPEDVMTEGEVLFRLKEIALTAIKDSDRISALKEIARLLRYGDPDEGKERDLKPVLELTLYNDETEVTQTAKQGTDLNSN